MSDKITGIFYSQNTHLFKFNNLMDFINLPTVLPVIKLNKYSSIYNQLNFESKLFQIYHNYNQQQIFNHFSFYSFPLLLGWLIGFSPLTYIQSQWGCLLILHTIEYYILFFRILLMFKISQPSIFQNEINLCSQAKKDDIFSGFIFYQTFILSITSLLLYTLYKYLTNITSTRIQSFSQSNFISSWPVYLQYLLISVNSCFLAVSRSTLLITHLYVSIKLIKLDTLDNFADAFFFQISTDSTSFSLVFSKKLYFSL